jgi:hypothetical protein
MKGQDMSASRKHVNSPRENAIHAAYRAKLRYETIRAAFLQAQGRAITERLEAIRKARAA